MIWASATGNTIGGPAALTGTAPGNVISGNSGPGIFFDNNVASTGDLVEGNLIGTDAAGTAALANGGLGGIYILSNDSATHETIGGTAAADRNVISGNNGAGFEILNDNSNLIEGNYVGLDITGMSAVPNLIQGIQIVGSNDNTVGGAAAGSGNVISGNRDNATAGQQLVINDENLSTQTASGNLVQGNLIGTNAAGTGLPSGMSFDYDGTGVNIIGCAAGNTIGGTLAGSANVIAGNATGVFIGSVGFLAGGTTSGNVVDGNDIGVEANGTTALANTVGVLIQSGVGNSLTDDNTIGGATAAAANLISGNTTLGIEISGSTATGNVVAGDYIGTDLNGMVAIANATGVELDTGASGNTIGGLTAAPGTGAGNVISGNTNNGVEIDGTGTTDNVVAGNLIGTDSTGTAALGNLIGGVLVDTGATANLIGGTTASARNIISANGYSGLQITDANDNSVEGNYVGTDKTGTLALGNNAGSGAFGDGFGGVTLDDGSSGNTIGGLTATPGSGAGNLISGNLFAGVLLYYAGSDNSVAGNLIGTDSTGTVPLGNLFDPAVSFGGAGVGVEYSPDTTVGEPGGRNVISGNGAGTLDGTNVYLLNSSASVVQCNYIGTDITGTVALSSTTLRGVAFQFGSYTIGGLTPTPGTGLGNVISGNSIGIYYAGYTASDTVAIEGNIIGADATGEHELPNSDGGVLLYQVSLVTIGGTAAGAGNLISGDNRPGSEGNIYLDDSTDNAVEGNLIGTDLTGLAGLPPLAGDVGGLGVYIAAGSADNTIGGITAAARNIISGIDGSGVYITDSTTTGNVVLGNFIGTVLSGTAALANDGDGVAIESGATDNTIGGTASGAGNVISGNTTDGVEISGTGTSGNVVAGDYIGTDLTGMLAIANPTGVELDTGATGNTIGGTVTLTRNLISGNLSYGVSTDTTAGANVIEGDFIGTDATGNVGLSDGTGIDILSAGNTIGGTASGAANVIAGNDGTGYSMPVRKYSWTLPRVTTSLRAIISASRPMALRWPAQHGSDVYINHATGETIGGVTAADRNVISGNSTGVEILGGSDNLIAGNYIGTDPTGSSAIGNGPLNANNDVAIGGGSTNNTVGGTTPGAAQRHFRRWIWRRRFRSDNDGQPRRGRLYRHGQRRAPLALRQRRRSWILLQAAATRSAA